MPESPFADTRFTSGPVHHEPAPAQFSQANGVYCRYCGSTPGLDLDFRAHRGMVFIMQFRKLPGPYCRDCGLASFRKMTGDSLVQGWWGPVSFLVANPVTLLINAVNRARLGSLAPPIPGGPSRPMDPGKPLYLRPQLLGLLVPIGLIVVLIVSATSSSSSSSHHSYPSSGSYNTYPVPTFDAPVMPTFPTAPVVPTTPATRGAKAAKVGDCVWDSNGPIQTDNTPKVEIVDCGDQRAQATVLGKPTGPTADTECDTQYPATDVIITHKVSYGGGPELEDFALCLQLK